MSYPQRITRRRCQSIRSLWINHRPDASGVSTSRVMDCFRALLFSLSTTLSGSGISLRNAVETYVDNYVDVISPTARSRGFGGLKMRSPSGPG